MKKFISEADTAEMKSYFALLLAIIALHCFVFTFIVESLFPLVLAILDSLAAVAIGIMTKDTIGHSAVVMGIFVILISCFVIIFL
ncbi:hypothetical protein PAECIP111893_00728 [Paenibacillus plantiphilus]|uniref:Uncharacterized protein n=1 Tax=Paenibacillus plantiphilus TaxID=2905650 RepID=A0ABN8G2C2_9BACL|nr:hypothetical protein [Paenibacillus plantiphilus]CAH1195610.1 hypothetical protein PAECIP111893_00728 [Paenibacillus plantiphilus]